MSHLGSPPPKAVRHRNIHDVVHGSFFSGEASGMSSAATRSDASASVVRGPSRSTARRNPSTVPQFAVYGVGKAGTSGVGASVAPTGTPLPVGYLSCCSCRRTMSLEDKPLEVVRALPMKHHGTVTPSLQGGERATHSRQLEHLLSKVSELVNAGGSSSAGVEMAPRAAPAGGLHIKREAVAHLAEQMDEYAPGNIGYLLYRASLSYDTLLDGSGVPASGGEATHRSTSPGAGPAANSVRLSVATTAFPHQEYASMVNLLRPPRFFSSAVSVSARSRLMHQHRAFLARCRRREWQRQKERSRRGIPTQLDCEAAMSPRISPAKATELGSNLGNGGLEELAELQRASPSSLSSSSTLSDSFVFSDTEYNNCVAPLTNSMPAGRYHHIRPSVFSPWFSAVTRGRSPSQQTHSTASTQSSLSSSRSSSSADCARHADGGDASPQPDLVSRPASTPPAAHDARRMARTARSRGPGPLSVSKPSRSVAVARIPPIVGYPYHWLTHADATQYCREALLAAGVPREDYTFAPTLTGSTPFTISIGELAGDGGEMHRLTPVSTNTSRPCAPHSLTEVEPVPPRKCRPPLASYVPRGLSTPFRAGGNGQISFSGTPHTHWSMGPRLGVSSQGQQQIVGSLPVGTAASGDSGAAVEAVSDRAAQDTALGPEAQRAAFSVSLSNSPLLLPRSMTGRATGMEHSANAAVAEGIQETLDGNGGCIAEEFPVDDYDWFESLLDSLSSRQWTPDSMEGVFTGLSALNHLQEVMEKERGAQQRRRATAKTNPATATRPKPTAKVGPSVRAGSKVAVTGSWSPTTHCIALESAGGKLPASSTSSSASLTFVRSDGKAPLPLPTASEQQPRLHSESPSVVAVATATSAPLPMVPTDRPAVPGAVPTPGGAGDQDLQKASDPVGSVGAVSVAFSSDHRRCTSLDDEWAFTREVPSAPPRAYRGDWGMCMQCHADPPVQVYKKKLLATILRRPRDVTCCVDEVIESIIAHEVHRKACVGRLECAGGVQDRTGVESLGQAVMLGGASGSPHPAPSSASVSTEGASSRTGDTRKGQWLPAPQPPCESEPAAGLLTEVAPTHQSDASKKGSVYPPGATASAAAEETAGVSNAPLVDEARQLVLDCFPLLSTVSTRQDVSAELVRRLLRVSVHQSSLELPLCPTCWVEQLEYLKKRCERTIEDLTAMESCADPSPESLALCFQFDRPPPSLAIRPRGCGGTTVLGSGSCGARHGTGLLDSALEKGDVDFDAYEMDLAHCPDELHSLREKVLCMEEAARRGDKRLADLKVEVEKLRARSATIRESTLGATRLVNEAQFVELRSADVACREYGRLQQSMDLLSFLKKTHAACLAYPIDVSGPVATVVGLRLGYSKSEESVAASLITHVPLVGLLAPVLFPSGKPTASSQSSGRVGWPTSAEVPLSAAAASTRSSSAISLRAAWGARGSESTEWNRSTAMLPTLSDTLSPFSMNWRRNPTIADPYLYDPQATQYSLSGTGTGAGGSSHKAPGEAHTAAVGDDESTVGQQPRRRSSVFHKSKLKEPSQELQSSGNHVVNAMDCNVHLSLPVISTSTMEINIACGMLMELAQYLVVRNGWVLRRAVFRPNGSRSTIEAIFAANSAAAAGGREKLAVRGSTSAEGERTESLGEPHRKVFDFFIDDRFFAWKTFGLGWVAFAVSIRELGGYFTERLRAYKNKRLNQVVHPVQCHSPSSTSSVGGQMPLADQVTTTATSNGQDTVLSESLRRMKGLYGGTGRFVPASSPDDDRESTRAHTGASPEEHASDDMCMSLPDYPPFVIDGERVDGFSVKHGDVSNEIWTMGVKKLMTNVQWCVMVHVALQRAQQRCDDTGAR